MLAKSFRDTQILAQLIFRMHQKSKKKIIYAVAVVMYTNKTKRRFALL